MITVKQITPVYDEKEDRIRLIININHPDRYDLWITRKFLIDIIDNLQNFLGDLKPSLDTNKKEDDDNITNDKEKTIYPPNNKPSLLQTINISSLENNQLLVTLTDENKKEFKFILSKEELKNLINLILKNVQFQWGLGFL